MKLALAVTLALALQSACEANLPSLVPEPLVGTGFPTEHSNYLCAAPALRPDCPRPSSLPRAAAAADLLGR